MSTNNIPLIKSGHAILSLRDSGYSIDAALGEVIDNSIEANANNIRVELFEGLNKKSKKCVNRIAIIDDGHGMNGEVNGNLHHYPQIGYSTRYMSTTTIGKYGVGAKLAALNYGRRFEVWSRTSPGDHWQYVYFDLDDFADKPNTDTLDIAPPVSKKLPKDLFGLAPEGSGTIVLWSKVDRLEEGRHAIDFNELKLLVEQAISRIFRYYLEGGIKININGKNVLPHDPLMLMEKSYSDSVLRKHYRSLAKQESEVQHKVKYHYPAIKVAKKKIKVDDSFFDITITLYPKEATRTRGKGGDTLSKKLRIPENQGSISFMRFKREVSYTNVPRIFPRGVTEADRFIGIEVSFNPNLDEYFGVRNVKRGVEPHDGELRKQIREFLFSHLPTARKMLDDAWGAASQEDKTHLTEHDHIQKAVKDVNATLIKSNVKGDKKEDAKRLKDLAQDVVGSEEDKQLEYLEQIKDFPFVIVSTSFPGTQFIDIQYLTEQTIIRLNTRHRFYREVWEPLKHMSSGDSGSITGLEAKDLTRRAVEALSLMIVAFGKAGSLNPNAEREYSELTNQWGTYLDLFMKKIKDVN